MKKSQVYLVIAVLVMVLAAAAVFAFVSMNGTELAMGLIQPNGHLVCSSTSCIG